MNYKKAIKQKKKPYHNPTEETQSPHWLAQYGVSLHCAKRWDERVFGGEQHRHITDDELLRIAKVIVGSLDITLTPTTSCTVPLLDKYLCVIRNGICITIKER